MSYINKNNNESYPYEVDVIKDPMDYSDLPEWFTDLLLVDHMDENGKPIFKLSKNDDGSCISYYIPITAGWLNVSADEVIIRNLGNNKISQLKKDIFNYHYVDKSEIKLINRLIKKLKGIYGKGYKCLHIL